MRSPLLVVVAGVVALATLGSSSSTIEDLETQTTALPNYCFDFPDFTCYFEGVPECCKGRRQYILEDCLKLCVATSSSSRNRLRSCDANCYNDHDNSIVCPIRPPGCEIRRIRPGMSCTARTDVCTSGFECLRGICLARIKPGGACRVTSDFCASGYSCVAGFCRVNSAITRGGACRAGDICEGSLACINGRCSSTFLPIGARCFPGDVCMNSMPCLNGICSSATWYTNWQRCLMDCPVYAGPCCGGPMPSSGAGQPYSTVDGCCAQSAFQGQRDACLARSRCTLKDDYVSSE